MGIYGNDIWEIFCEAFKAEFILTALLLRIFQVLQIYYNLLSLLLFYFI
jgi:hypothetical protein